MTASFKDLPSISRLIAELSGEIPGVSLYEIVTERCAWNILPRIQHDPDILTLQFSGGSGEDIVAYYTATMRNRPVPIASRNPPSEDHLILTWKETSTQRFQIICRSKGGNIPETLVQVYVRRGENSFPIWGDPHPHRVDDMDNGLRFRTALGGGTFLATRMYLAMSIDWQKEILRDSPKNIAEIEERYLTFFISTAKGW